MRFTLTTISCFDEVRHAVENFLLVFLKGLIKDLSEPINVAQIEPSFFGCPCLPLLKFVGLFLWGVKILWYILIPISRV